VWGGGWRVEHSQQWVMSKEQPVPRPAFRRLRGYAFDPSLSLQMDTALANEVVFKVTWEESGLERGPIGEYLEVVDYDPASGCFYEPIDLNSPLVLAQDGLAPSEGNPQFHQQMVYAVAMTTIRNFERALGRPALWAPYRPGPGKGPDEFVRRLRIYPHALRDTNAYYSPDKKALLFGYFPAPESTAVTAAGSAHFPGGWVFTCLSHDVVAHETTHALLDGMHRRFIERTHPDSLAFHEAFADLVALFQHFTFPEALRHQIGRTRGNLASQNMLGQLAQQFGRAIGQHGALRDAIGEIDPESGKWRPLRPDPDALRTTFEPHARGAILVAAVFDAFLAIYRRRVTDLFRIASSGTGILPDGDLQPDLVNRLAVEAAKASQHVLQMCIRALDYCPPLDITFGDYLRAIITADSDLVPDDDLGYRIAFIEAFRRRGIYPRSVRTLSLDSLRWPLAMRGEESTRIKELARMIKDELRQAEVQREQGREAVLGLRDHAETRFDYFTRSQLLAERLHAIIRGPRLKTELEHFVRGDISFTEPLEGLKLNGEGPRFEVHSVRPALRVGPDGDRVNHVVVVITQKRVLPLDPARPDADVFPFRGGCTLIFNLDTFELQYAIGKSIRDPARLARQREFLQTGRLGDLHSTYFGPRQGGGHAEPFAMLHRMSDGGRP
jgi:hypothetical protein